MRLHPLAGPQATMHRTRSAAEGWEQSLEHAHSAGRPEGTRPSAPVCLSRDLPFSTMALSCSDLERMGRFDAACLRGAATAPRPALHNSAEQSYLHAETDASVRTCRSIVSREAIRRPCPRVARTSHIISVGRGLWPCLLDSALAFPRTSGAMHLLRFPLTQTPMTLPQDGRSRLQRPSSKVGPQCTRFVGTKTTGADDLSVAPDVERGASDGGTAKKRMRIMRRPANLDPGATQRIPAPASEIAECRYSFVTPSADLTSPARLDVGRAGLLPSHPAESCPFRNRIRHRRKQRSGSSKGPATSIVLANAAAKIAVFACIRTHPA
jgi:hypothetical protein